MGIFEQPLTCPVEHSFDAPRGSRIPGLVQTLLSFRHPVGFSRWLQHRFGDVFVTKAFPLGCAVTISDPDLVQEIFRGPHDALHAGVLNGIFSKAIFGARAVSVVDGAEHTETRKRLLPPFRGKEISGYEATMRGETLRRIEHWTVGGTIRMHDEARAITLEVMLRTVFGAGEGTQVDELRHLMVLSKITVVSSLWMVFPALGRVPPWRSFARLVAHLNGVLDEFIAQRRTAPDLDDRTDILSLLVRNPANDDEWIRHQLVALLGAGQETTATSLAWAMELLSRHPDIRQKAREGEDAYLDAVINETLRIRTVLPGVGRKLSRPMSLGGYRFPAGAMLNPQIESIHGDARIWGDPEVFRPERFLDEKPSTRTFLPFGGGKRRCIGAQFAQTEMRVALRTILDAIDFEHVGAQAETQKHSFITLVPSRGAQIHRTR